MGEAMDFGLPEEVDDEAAMVEAMVLSAQLPPGNTLRTPYVELCAAGGGRRRTSTKTGTRPVWNEMLSLDLPTPPPKALQLNVYDGEDTLLGELGIPLQGLRRDQYHDMRIGLRVHDHGLVSDSYVSVRVCARGFGCLQ
eukprot:NODE_4173_length_689_cov_79.425000_g3542_i0.p1 GENE.NODE_4173_length_689_cov_79.425000_g3542_i0~~NODE_4173_length_689_cov_79.425000_g3542_i0.p1  ORF type:complete len:147 (-),score=51.78 NODE_4173_length_689_cov_79.425000_g3542_i0:247-663(-)